MAYLKLFKTCQDHAVGVQSVQQALDNNLALYTQLDEKHSVGLGGNAVGDPFLGPGRHDDILVARTAADFLVDTAGAVVSCLMAVSGPMIFDVPEYLADGQWKIYVTSPRLFGAVASVRSEGSGYARAAQVRVYMDAGGPYVIVTTWNVLGGTYDNFNFSLCVWTESVI